MLCEERILKNVLNYKVRLEKLEDSWWPRMVYIMAFSNRLFIKLCVYGRTVEWKTITDDRTRSNLSVQGKIEEGNRFKGNWNGSGKMETQYRK